MYSAWPFFTLLVFFLSPSSSIHQKIIIYSQTVRSVVEKGNPFSEKSFPFTGIAPSVSRCAFAAIGG